MAQRVDNVRLEVLWCLQSHKVSRVSVGNIAAGDAEYTVSIHRFIGKPFLVLFSCSVPPRVMARTPSQR
jgi:hypothetical protein